MLTVAIMLAEKYHRWRMTLPEVAAELGYAEGTVRNKFNRGELPFFYKDGGMLFADVRDVAAYLDEQRKRVEA